MRRTASENSAASPGKLDGKCILVVDDDDDARALLRGALERHGVAVCDVGSAEEALEALAWPDATSI